MKGGSGGGEEHQHGDEEDSAIFILRLTLRWVLLFILPSSFDLLAVCKFQLFFDPFPNC